MAEARLEAYERGAKRRQGALLGLSGPGAALPVLAGSTHAALTCSKSGCACTSYCER